MCQESLISYLNTNSDISREDIESLIRLGDVALGSIIKEQEQIKKYKNLTLNQSYLLQLRIIMQNWTNFFVI